MGCQRAAALTRVEDGTIDNLLGRPGNVDVVSDVGRILSSKLQSHVHEAVSRRLLDSETACDSASEAYQLDGRVSDDGLHDGGGATVEVLQHALGQASSLEDLSDTLGNGGGLGRRLQDDGVAGENGWDERVDEGQVRILVRHATVVSLA